MLSMGYIVGICWGSKIICYYAIYGAYSRNMLGFFQRSYAIMLSMGYIVGICWGSFKDHMLLCYLWGI